MAFMRIQELPKLEWGRWGNMVSSCLVRNSHFDMNRFPTDI